MVLPVVVEEQRFGASFAFVLAGARIDGINVTPIVYILKMHYWIAVNFRGGSLKYAPLDAVGKPEHVDCAIHADFSWFEPGQFDSERVKSGTPGCRTGQPRHTEER